MEFDAEHKDTGTVWHVTIKGRLSKYLGILTDCIFQPFQDAYDMGLKDGEKEFSKAIQPASHTRTQERQTRNTPASPALRCKATPGQDTAQISSEVPNSK